MGKTFAEMEDMYGGVVKRFKMIELQEWKAQGAMIELAKHIRLKKDIMLWKGKYSMLTSVSGMRWRM